MSTIRRLFSIDVIASVQDKVSTIQSSEVSTDQRFFKWYKGEIHSTLSTINSRCLLFGVSTKRGFTVYNTTAVAKLSLVEGYCMSPYYISCWCLYN